MTSDHSRPLALFAGGWAQRLVVGHGPMFFGRKMGCAQDTVKIWRGQEKSMRGDHRTSHRIICALTMALSVELDRSQRLSVHNYQHHDYDGRFPRPHLTLFSLCKRCALRRAPQLRKTPARVVISPIIQLIDTNLHTHNNDPYPITPRLNTNTNPLPLLRGPR